MRASPVARRLSIHSETSVPTVDAVEARWAADAVANLSRQLDSDSVVSMVLRRAQQELLSLADSGHESASGRSHVIGPVRLRVAG